MWQRFSSEFFSHDAYLVLTLPSALQDDSSLPPQSYTISRALIPRFFYSWAESGLSGLYLVVERIKETFLPNSLLLLDSSRIKLVSNLHDGQQMVEHKGSIRLLFNQSAKIQFMELSLSSFEQFLNSRCENLFSLPLQAGFDAGVHSFLSMLVLVQTSFQNLEALSMPMAVPLPILTATHMPLLDEPIKAAVKPHLPILLPKPSAPASPSSTSASGSPSTVPSSTPAHPAL